MNVRVYLGPTLPHEDALEVLDADYRPPIRQADLPLALAEGVDVAVIIDAAFVQTLTATPTQILQCLAQGMVIYGASSAGALRAAECAPFGMRGVGGVYGLYAGGFEAEDEVAVTFDPESLRPMSDAMVNVRYACAAAVRDGAIEAAAAEQLMAVAKSIHFIHRTYATIERAADGLVDAVALAAFREYRAAQGDALDWKRNDALECLRRVREFVASAAGRSTARAPASQARQLGDARAAGEQATGRRDRSLALVALDVSGADWEGVVAAATAHLRSFPSEAAAVRALHAALASGVLRRAGVATVVHCCQSLVLAGHGDRGTIELWAAAEQASGRSNVAAALARRANTLSSATCDASAASDAA